MLKISCSNKEKVGDDVLKYFETYPCKFKVEDCEDGWVLKGMHYANCFEHADYLEVNDKGFLTELMRMHPELDVIGSIQFGDDNYRPWYWFKSESGVSEVKYEKSSLSGDCENDEELGEPLSQQINKAWKVIKEETDYGEVYSVFTTREEFIEALYGFVESCEIFDEQIEEELEEDEEAWDEESISYGFKECMWENGLDDEVANVIQTIDSIDLSLVNIEEKEILQTAKSYLLRIEN